MAFSGTVRVQLNGTWTTLTYNSSSGAYEATLTAPGKTSFNETGGVYVVTAEATNTAGTAVTETVNLTVKETIKPVITISSPSSGAYISSNQPNIVFTVTDEANGSGVKIDSLSVKIDGKAITTGITKTAITNGYSVTVVPSTLDDGSHTVTINCNDNDGNSATEKSATFTVDTVPPVLNVTSPDDGLITNKNTVVVAGTTNDAASSPVTLTVNGDKVSVGSDGSFSKTVTLSEGENTITVEATDKAGKVSTVTRTVTFDSSTPVIESIEITPNPVNTSESMLISVVVK